MEWLDSLIFGEGIAHSVLILSAVIALGVFLGKVKVAGISLGVTWILFIGILFSHFGMRMDPHTLHFVREFGKYRKSKPAAVLPQQPRLTGGKTALNQL